MKHKININELEAGTELNTLMTEMLGWTRLGDLEDVWKNPNDVDFRVWVTSNHIYPMPYRFFHPSENISDAMYVLEYMENNNWWWESENVNPNSDPIVYAWTFLAGDVSFSSGWQYSLPMAICKSALMATLHVE